MINQVDEDSVEAGFTCALVDNSMQVQPEEASKFYKLEHVTEGQSELITLLNRFPSVTSRAEYDIGNCTLPAMEVDTGRAEPICIPPRRMGPTQKEKIRKHVVGMTEAGILSKSDSAWSFPLVVAPIYWPIRP